MGNGTVTLSLNDHTGNTLRNLINIIWCKQSLIQKSLGRQETIIPVSLVNTLNAVPIDSLDDFANVINSAIETGEIKEECDLDFDLTDKTVSFSFLNASLDFDEVLSFITLCRQLNQQAIQQKFSSTKLREVINEKYAFRVWLLRLGFVGDDYKTERKVLLAKLSGDGVYANRGS